MEKTTEEGKAVARTAEELADEDELLKDRMDGAVVEMEVEKEARRGKSKFPISNKEPSRVHMLLRETQEAAMKWEASMREKYMQGQVSEIIDKIMECVNKGTEFPPKSQLYHNWTEEIMEQAKVGWRKYKATLELVEKYPMQSAEQIYHEDTKKWVLYDYSGLKKGTKRKKTCLKKGTKRTKT